MFKIPIAHCYFGKSVSYMASQVGEIFCFETLLSYYLNEYNCRNMIVMADQDEFPIMTSCYEYLNSVGVSWLKSRKLVHK